MVHPSFFRRHCPLTLSSEQIVDGSINLDPDYQRGINPVVLSVRLSNFFSRRKDVVWPEQKQVGLIDSVFRNYYIPPIIFGQFAVSRLCLNLLRSSQKRFRPRMTEARPVFASMGSSV